MLKARGAHLDYFFFRAGVIKEYLGLFEIIFQIIPKNLRKTTNNPQNNPKSEHPLC